MSIENEKKSKEIATLTKKIKELTSQAKDAKEIIIKILETGQDVDGTPILEKRRKELENCLLSFNFLDSDQDEQD
ncbi:MAG: hypothetical protein JSV73_04795 [Flavobacteriaceae bacterium]|nr:MAG: hypothetical protein JSV73_04795 [Flavobacteriaceae bacterium]